MNAEILDFLKALGIGASALALLFLKYGIHYYM